MKESYKVRPSQSPWPQVMRRGGQLPGRSVHRGTAGLCIGRRAKGTGVLPSPFSTPALAACVALPFVPDWRWLLERGHSPWYPTMRLFRQTTWGDWGPVFARIAAALQAGSGEEST